MCAVGILFLHVFLESRKVAKMSPEQRSDYLASLQNSARVAQLERTVKQFGAVNPILVCPHCQVKGHIRTKILNRKKGVSGGKATAALLTAGVSIWATGLSRKEKVTQAKCENCGSEWDF